MSEKEKPKHQQIDRQVSSFMVEAGFSAVRAFTARRGVTASTSRTQAAADAGGMPADFNAAATAGGNSSARAPVKNRAVSIMSGSRILAIL